MKKRKKRYLFKKKFAKTIERQTIRKVMLLSKKDITDLTSNTPPLSMEDKLFIQTENLCNSCLNRSAYVREHHLSDSYFCNAIFLLDLIHESNSNAVRDGYIYPALFSFRHYLELTMKDTLNQKEGIGKVAKVVTDKVHTLLDIWESFKSIVPQDEECSIIESLIKEISDADPYSFSFRYTYDIRGNKIRININKSEGNDIEDVGSLEENEDDSDDLMTTTPILIDNENLRSIMLKMYDYFDGINWLAHN